MHPIYNNTVETVEDNKRVTLKVLNSQLSGCEFELTQKCTFFNVSSPKTLNECSAINVDALIIPITEGGINFEVIIDHNLSQSVEIVQHTDSGLIKKIVNFNEEIHVGSLMIIMKLANASWTDTSSVKDKKNTAKSYKQCVKKPAAFFMLLVAVIFSLVYFKIYFSSESDNIIPSAHSNLLNNKNIISLDNAAKNVKKEAIKASLSVKDVEYDLQHMNIKFTKDKFKNLTTFNFIGELDDESIRKIKNLNSSNSSNAYDFAINLKDKPINDKSFKYGEYSYVKMSTNHWLLNNTQ